ncbi:uncharacterized protein LOC114279813 isoform X6 [Camellia sinensis]|nr:uncharacterized protein LOC114279813 isoform X6 [Camellia sinensis]
MSLGGILFQRAWLQGVLVSIASGDGDGGGSFLLDDGTGVIELSLSGDFLNLPWNLGMYVMVVGGFFVRTAEIPIIKQVHLKPWLPLESKGIQTLAARRGANSLTTRAATLVV